MRMTPALAHHNLTAPPPPATTNSKMKTALSLFLLLLAVAAFSPAAVAAEEEGSCPFAHGGGELPGWHSRPMPDDYSGGLKEFSVVYTDRALNHMSAPFVKVMQDLNELLNGVYNAAATVILPGSGTFAMEAVARQFALGKKALVARTIYL